MRRKTFERYKCNICFAINNNFNNFNREYKAKFAQRRENYDNGIVNENVEQF